MGREHTSSVGKVRPFCFISNCLTGCGSDLAMKRNLQFSFQIQSYWVLLQMSLKFHGKLEWKKRKGECFACVLGRWLQVHLKRPEQRNKQPGSGPPSPEFSNPPPIAYFLWTNISDLEKFQICRTIASIIQGIPVSVSLSFLWWRSNNGLWYSCQN